MYRSRDSMKWVQQNEYSVGVRQTQNPDKTEGLHFPLLVFWKVDPDPYDNLDFSLEFPIYNKLTHKWSLTSILEDSV